MTVRPLDRMAIVLGISNSVTCFASCVLGGTSLYMLLSGRRSAVRWCGMGCGALALSLLGLALSTPFAWWSGLMPESTASSLLFVLSGLAAVGCAGLTVTAARAENAVLWFVATLICVAALYAVHDAQYLSAGTVFVGGGTATLLLLVGTRGELVHRHIQTEGIKDLLLVCLCGGLLAMGLMAVVQRALGATSIRDTDHLSAVVERWQSRGHPVAGQRSIPDGQAHGETAGRSLFEDHALAIVLSAVLLFVAIIVSLLLTRESSRLQATQGFNEIGFEAKGDRNA